MTSYVSVEEARVLYLKLAGMVTASLRLTGEVDDKLYRVCSKNDESDDEVFREDGGSPVEGGSMKLATLVKDLGTSQEGEGHKLYRLSEPLVSHGGERYEYVVVSAADVMYSGPETYIFGADENGEVVD